MSKSPTPVTDKVREVLGAIVIFAGKHEQKNSFTYPMYKELSEQS